MSNNDQSNQNLYPEYVFYDKLVSPVNGYECRRINSQNIKRFGFDSVETLVFLYPNFPLTCQKSVDTHRDRCLEHDSTLLEGRIKAKKQVKLQYLENPKLCVRCRKPIDFEKRDNKFCSRSCSASYHNSKRDVDFYEKQKASLYNTRLLAGLTVKKNNQNIKYQSDPQLSFKFEFVSEKHKCKYCGKRHTSNQNRMSCECGITVNPQSFSGLEKYFGLTLDNLGTPQFKYDLTKCKDHAEELYSTNSLPSLAKLLLHPDKTGGNIGKILKSLGIPLDSKDEAQRKSRLQGRGFLNRGSNIYKNGTIIIGKKEYYYRSSYEEKMIFHLIDIGITDFSMEIHHNYYDYHLDKQRAAYPDFEKENVIVEVKSEWTFNKDNMRDKFSAYIEEGYYPYLWLEFKYYQLIDDEFYLMPDDFDPWINHFM